MLIYRLKQYCPQCCQKSKMSSSVKTERECWKQYKKKKSQITGAKIITGKIKFLSQERQLVLLLWRFNLLPWIMFSLMFPNPSIWMQRCQKDVFFFFFFLKSFFVCFSIRLGFRFHLKWWPCRNSFIIYTNISHLQILTRNFTTSCRPATPESVRYFKSIIHSVWEPK